VPTALADPPAAPSEQPATAGSVGAPPASASAGDASSPRACANCGAALTEGQDWCLQCGTGAPDSLRSRAPSWRSAAVILTALALLVVGAGGAAYAALSKGGRKAPPTATVAQVATPPAAATPVQPASGAVPPTASAKIGTPTTIKPVTPLGTAKAPKIPLSVPTPTTPVVTPVAPTGATKAPAAKTPTTTTKQTTAPVVGEAHPEALLLDTNAAATYNPYNYSVSNFGDPSLAIDGDASTGWTALVEPNVAPKLAEGLIIDLNSAHKLAALTVKTTTPGMFVRVYGANTATAPASITDPAWIALSPTLAVAKKQRIKFAASGVAAQPYRFIVLWISQAPASAVGTPQAPGHVSVNEVELFERKKS
jgi:hypothetical protein